MELPKRNKPPSLTTSPRRMPIHLLLDFDGTITEDDTTSVLAKIGLEQHEIHETTAASWDDLSSAYLSDYCEHLDTYQPTAENRKIFEQECDWLRSLHDVEEKSFKRACEGNVFQHFRNLDYSSFAKEVRNAMSDGRVRVREGWRQLFEAVQEYNTRLPKEHVCAYVSVVSISWSRRWILECLVAAGLSRRQDEVFSEKDVGGTTTEREVSETQVKCSEIFSNEIGEFTEDHIDHDYRWHYASLVHDSGNKLHVQQQIRKKLDDESLLIYIGDSVTDLECLVEADFGICLRSTPMTRGQQELALTCERLGIPTIDIDQLPQAVTSDSDGDKKMLLFSSSVSGIVDWFDVLR